MAPQLAHRPTSQRTHADAPDTELLEEVRRGDAGALQALIDRYWTLLLGFARRIVGSDDAAEDAVQCALIRFWEYRERWQAGSEPRLILYTLVRNLSLNQVASERARVRRGADRRSVLKAWVETPAQVLEERELQEALARALEELSPRRREALVLARFHDMTHPEIAQVMGLAKRTVTNHITTALAELETALERYLAG